MGKGNKPQSKISRKPKGSSVDSDRRHLRRFLLVWTPVIIIVLGCFYALVLDPVNPSSAKRFEAVLVDTPESPSADAGSARSCTVQFADGRLATLSIRHTGEFRKGMRLIVEERKTLLLKRKTHQFVSFLN